MISIDNILELNWKKNKGLMPVIVQDNNTLQVLMLGYMNQEALLLTMQNKKATFFSRSRNQLWMKGETSGNYLSVIDILFDCDQDTLLVLVEPNGNTCHLERSSCFNTDAKSSMHFIKQLENLIDQRYQMRFDGSYVAQLFNAGLERIAQKVGEEAIETVIAAMANDERALLNEAADLIFHLMVLLRQCRIPLHEIVQELQNRMK